MSRLRISVIVTTYNRPNALKFVLQGLARQTQLPLDVIVADDGSTSETTTIIQELIPSSPYQLKHIWQQDKGFRAAKARNKAVAVAEGDYLVFLDGDCIPCESFLNRHSQFCEKNMFVTGNRILLSKAFTEKFELLQSDLCQLNLLQLLGYRLNGHFNRLLPLLAFPDATWRTRIVSKKWQGSKTCNLSLTKHDFLNINGFDESYEGWGHEDADLTVRLMAAGVQRKDGRWGTGVFHLWHAENDRSHEQENKQRLLKIIKNAKNNIYARKGVSAYIDNTNK